MCLTVFLAFFLLLFVDAFKPLSLMLHTFTLCLLHSFSYDVSLRTEMEFERSELPLGSMCVRSSVFASGL